jgi:hypothetical protein
MTITSMNRNVANTTNRWISSHTLSRYSGDASVYGGGRLSIQSETAVDRVQILPDYFGEIASFTSGSVNVMFE